MKKFRILLLTGMILGATAFAGCGKMAEDDINNKEVFSDDLEPLTEEELDAMDADTSDDDMEAIDNRQKMMHRKIHRIVRRIIRRTQIKILKVKILQIKM